MCIPEFYYGEEINIFLNYTFFMTKMLRDFYENKNQLILLMKSGNDYNGKKEQISIILMFPAAAQSQQSWSLKLSTPYGVRSLDKQVTNNWMTAAAGLCRKTQEDIWTPFWCGKSECAAVIGERIWISPNLVSIFIITDFQKG